MCSSKIAYVKNIQAGFHNPCVKRCSRSDIVNKDHHNKTLRYSRLIIYRKEFTREKNYTFSFLLSLSFSLNNNKSARTRVSYLIVATDYNLSSERLGSIEALLTVSPRFSPFSRSVFTSDKLRYVCETRKFSRRRARHTHSQVTEKWMKKRTHLTRQKLLQSINDGYSYASKGQTSWFIRNKW